MVNVGATVAREANSLGLAATLTETSRKSESPFSSSPRRLPLARYYNNLGVERVAAAARKRLEYFQRTIENDPSDPTILQHGVPLFPAGDRAGAAREIRHSARYAPERRRRQDDARIFTP